MQPAPSDNEALLRRAIDGDEAALADLLHQHYGRLSGYVRRRLPAAMQTVIATEDIIQDTHVQVFRKISTFKSDTLEAFVRAMLAIARQRLLDRIREQNRLKRGGGRKRAEGSSVDSLSIALVGEGGTPSSAAGRREWRRAVQVAVAGLKDDYRQVIVMRYIDDLPAADVAAHMGRSEQAIHMLCQRALKRLRSILGSLSRIQMPPDR